MQSKGPWNADQVESFLNVTRVPARLACNGASGFPVIVSLWFVPLGGHLWCATQDNASVIRHLRRDDRCAFEVAEESSPYRGVRGQAVAHLHKDRGDSILRLLIDRYLEDPNSRLAHWLIGRSEREVAIEIAPNSLMSWDYSARMDSAA